MLAYSLYSKAATNSYSFFMITCFFMLKGAKLRLEDEIGNLVVGHGEFIVLVPFARKSVQCSPVGMASEELSGVNPLISSEMSAEASSAWQDIMDDLSAIPSSPQADAAPKDLYLSSIPCSGRYAEDVPTGPSSSTGCSTKRRKLCKENGNGSRDMPTSGVNCASEKLSMNKKSGVVKSAASSCHVGIP